MAATLNMTAVPGHFENQSGYRCKTLEIMGREFGKQSKIIGTVADAREAIAAFGASIRAAYPGESFAILASIGKRDRKPRGFDDADRQDSLGADAFLLLRKADAA